MVQSRSGTSQGPSASLHLTPLDQFQGSLGNRVYLTLREAILSLAYRPGEVLRKPQICSLLAVSRSPVSDAVARLAAEGLLAVYPQAGTYVARFSMADIREGAFLRESIELAAVEKVAAIITEDQLALLRRNISMQALMVDSGDAAGFYKLDGEMHDLILGFTGFKRLTTTVDSAWVHVNRARRLVLPFPGRVTDSLEEHRQILSALEARDPDAARRAMRVHLGQLLRLLEPLERERPELFT